MSRPTKKEQIPNLPDAIKETAWEQIAKSGAAALSLRAIARELGITAPAIYNYFSRRDDLVTALIVDAFTSLGNSQKAAIRGLPDEDLRSRIYALGIAYRAWAITYPQRYQLIFGTPIPGYEAPADITVPAAAESLVPLIQTLQACFEKNMLRLEQDGPMSPEFKTMFEAWSHFTGGVVVEVLYTALVFWSRVHGLVSLEIGQQFPAYITNPGGIFRREIGLMLVQYLGE